MFQNKLFYFECFSEQFRIYAFAHSHVSVLTYTIIFAYKNWIAQNGNPA